MGVAAVAQRMRRQFGPSRGAARPDVISDKDDDSAAREAYRKAKKAGEKRKGEDGRARKDNAKVKGSGQTLNGVEKRAGLRNRRHRRGSEYDPAPRRPMKDAPRRDSASLLHFCIIASAVGRVFLERGRGAQSRATVSTTFRLQWSICVRGCGLCSGLGNWRRLQSGTSEMVGASQRNLGTYGTPSGSDLSCLCAAQVW